MKVYIVVGVLLMSLWGAEAYGYASPVQHYGKMVIGSDAMKAKALKDEIASLKSKYAGQCKETGCTLEGSTISCTITSCSTEAYNHPYGYGDCAPVKAFIDGCYLEETQDKTGAYPKCCRKVTKYCKGQPGFQESKLGHYTAEKVEHCKHAHMIVA